MINWVKWQADITDEAESTFGKGPFPIVEEVEEEVEILIPLRMPKKNITRSLKDINLEKRLRAVFSSGTDCTRCNCKQKKKGHLFTGEIAKVKEEPNPLAKNFRVGETVNTPEGPGEIIEIGRTMIKINIPLKGKISWDHRFITK